MLRVHTLVCGQVGVDPAVPDRGVSRFPLAYTGLLRSPARRIWLPVKAFLIRHPQGDLLVDAGWDSAVRRHPVRAIGFPMWFASKPRLPAGEAVDERLAALGLSPRRLHGVIVTHMDIDHASGLPLVREAGRIWISPQEAQALRSRQVRYLGKPWRGLPLTEISYQPDAEAPCGLSWDVFGDGTVQVLHLPGHTQGSLAVRVQGKNGFVLLVGDSGYNRASWEQGRLPGPVWNQAQLRQALHWVQTQRERPDCLAVLAAHDPEADIKTIELEE